MHSILFERPLMIEQINNKINIKFKSNKIMHNKLVFNTKQNESYLNLKKNTIDVLIISLLFYY